MKKKQRRRGTSLGTPENKDRSEDFLPSISITARRAYEQTAHITIKVKSISEVQILEILFSKSRYFPKFSSLFITPYNSSKRGQFFPDTDWKNATFKRVKAIAHTLFH
jgi:hypothetical protein